jgi:hypothetical protein
MLRKGKKGIEIHVVSKNPVQQVNGSNWKEKEVKYGTWRRG